MRPTSAILAMPSLVSNTLGDLQAHKASTSWRSWGEHGVTVPALRVPVTLCCVGNRQVSAGQMAGQAWPCLTACMALAVCGHSVLRLLHPQQHWKR